MVHAYQTTHNQIIRWYEESGRKDLPWRNTNDPYAVYLSEIMLQQTQVKTVLDRFYFPFIEHFPTLQSVAEADQEEVLKQWQGLGYYSRALHLWNTAKQTNGILPTSIEALMALPGIGQNTAHAIACFAFGQPVPILEANVKRIVARFFANPAPSHKQLWNYAAQLLNTKDAYTHNQALMDIGSLICTPISPQCNICPLAFQCQGKNNPTAYPTKRQTKTNPIRNHDIYVVLDNADRIFMQPRQSRFLNGLYEFIQVEQEEVPTHQGKPLDVSCAKALGSIRQSYSHFTLEARIFCLRLNTPGKGNNWYAMEQLLSLPKSKAEEKILAFIPPLR